MKKTLGIILAILMMLTLSVPALAAENVAQNDGNGKSDQTVSATYEEEKTSSDTVYYVKIDWSLGENTLKYSAGTQAYTWNGAEMKYEQNGPVAGAGWTGAAKVDVTVTNQSNATIVANSSSSSEYQLSITEDKSTLTLTSAAVDGQGSPLAVTSSEKGNAKIGTFAFTIKATEGSQPLAADGTVATLTVTIAPQP